jgi:hypothetical protein
MDIIIYIRIKHILLYFCKHLKNIFTNNYYKLCIVEILNYQYILYIK